MTIQNCSIVAKEGVVKFLQFGFHQIILARSLTTLREMATPATSTHPIVKPCFDGNEKVGKLERNKQSRRSFAQGLHLHNLVIQNRTRSRWNLLKNTPLLSPSLSRCFFLHSRSSRFPKALVSLGIRILDARPERTRSRKWDPSQEILAICV